MKRKNGFWMLLFFLLAVLSLPVYGKAANLHTTVLSPEKIYRYDLNKDGKKEKLKYEIVQQSQDPVSGRGTVKANIYVNGKKVLSKKLAEDSGIYYPYVTLSIGDLNKQDGYMDLFLSSSYLNTTDSFLYYLRYSSSKMKVVQNLTDLMRKTYKNTSIGTHPTLIDGKTVSYQGDTQTAGFRYNTGSHTLSTTVCIPTKSLGSIHCEAEMKLKNGKFQKPSKTLNVFETDNYMSKKIASRNYYMTALKKFTLHKGTSKKSGKAATVTRGTKLKAVKVKFTGSGKCSIYLESGNGKKKGWIESTELTNDRFFRAEGVLHV